MTLLVLFDKSILTTITTILSLVKDENPGLIFCSISGYGPSGPWSELPGYDVVIAGTHGLSKSIDS